MNAVFNMRVFFELAFFCVSYEIDILNIAEIEESIIGIYRCR